VPEPRRVVFYLHPDVHLLDLAGPAQVFSTANDFGGSYELLYVADTKAVASHQGVPLAASTGWPAVAAGDLIIVPGWRTPPGATPRSSFTKRGLQAMVEHHANGGTVASVCSGAVALGAAGLLDGRCFTTHHELQEALARSFPKASILRDVLFVEDDRVVTSAGIASGIDLALRLVAVEYGPAVASRVARAMVVFSRRNGHDQQQSVMLRHRGHLSDAVHRAQDIIDDGFTQTLRLTDVAAKIGTSERTLTRQFTKMTGLTPLRYQQALRLERAEHQLGQGATMESAARDAGFEDARMLRRLRNRPA
jgi:transcriptional regulator GlxA family with amidase domain